MGNKPKSKVMSGRAVKARLKSCIFPKELGANPRYDITGGGHEWAGVFVPRDHWVMAFPG